MTWMTMMDDDDDDRILHIEYNTHLIIDTMDRHALLLQIYIGPYKQKWHVYSSISNFKKLHHHEEQHHHQHHRPLA